MNLQTESDADVCCAVGAVVVLTGCATPHMMGDMWMPGESMEVSCVRAEVCIALSSSFLLQSCITFAYPADSITTSMCRLGAGHVTRAASGGIRWLWLSQTIMSLAPSSFRLGMETLLEVRRKKCAPFLCVPCVRTCLDSPSFLLSSFLLSSLQNTPGLLLQR